MEGVKQDRETGFKYGSYECFPQCFLSWHSCRTQSPSAELGVPREKRNCVLFLRAEFWFLLLLYESRMSVCYRSVMALVSTVKIWAWCCTRVGNAILWGLSSFPFHSCVLHSIHYAHSCVSVASSSFSMWIQSCAQVCYSTHSWTDKNWLAECM